MNKGAFHLRKASSDERSGRSEVLSVIFDSCQARLLRRVGTWEANISLGCFGIHDKTTPNSLFPNIVRLEKETNAEEDACGVASGTWNPYDDPLLYVDFVQNPLDRHADSSITVRIKPIEIFYPKHLIEVLAVLLRPPENQEEAADVLVGRRQARMTGCLIDN